MVFSDKLVFPYSKHPPSLSLQVSAYSNVAGPVLSKLGLPELLVMFRLGSVFRARMPETAIDKDGNPQLSKHKIRFAKKLVGVCASPQFRWRGKVWQVPVPYPYCRVRGYATSLTNASPL
jgi:hypothetical protein